MILVCSPLPGEEADELSLTQAARGLSNLIYCDRRGELRVSLASHLEHLVEGLDGGSAPRLAEGVESLRGSPSEAESRVSSSEMSLLSSGPVAMR